MDVGDKTNSIVGTWSSIAWWEFNTIEWNRSTVVWWMNHLIQWDKSTIAWWQSNIVVWNDSLIAWGYDNRVAWDYSTVAGWEQNVVTWDYSFAAGYGWKINHEWVFMRSDPLTFPYWPSNFTSTEPYTFLIRAYNGVAINTWGTASGLTLNVRGEVGAKAYCDENGDNCTDAGDLGGGWSDVFWTWSVTWDISNSNVGNLGIGTTDPTEKLDVNWTLRVRSISGALSANNALVINGSGKIFYVLLDSLLSGNEYRWRDGSSIYNTNTGGVWIGMIPDVGYALSVTGYSKINTTIFNSDEVSINMPITPIWVSLAVSGNFFAWWISSFHNINKNCAIVWGSDQDIGSAGNMSNAFIGWWNGNSITKWGAQSFIGWWSSNNIYLATNSAIVGGSNNDIMQVWITFSTVSNFIWWWEDNQIEWWANAIIAWGSNTIKWATLYSFVWWGNGNIISWWVSSFYNSNSIIWWANNTISSSNYSTIPWWSGNSIEGDYSFAAGQAATTNFDNTFVWNDGPSTFASTNNNQFLIHSSNGVGIGTNNPLATLDVNGSWYFRDAIILGTEVVATLPGWTTCSKEWAIKYFHDNVANWQWHFYWCISNAWTFAMVWAQLD